jgi:hypothetical protein
LFVAGLNHHRSLIVGDFRFFICTESAEDPIIRFKRSDVNPHLVIAASAEIQGEHLVFLRSDGSLAALFVLEIVESGSEVEL